MTYIIHNKILACTFEVNMWDFKVCKPRLQSEYTKGAMITININFQILIHKLYNTKTWELA